MHFTAVLCAIDMYSLHHLIHYFILVTIAIAEYKLWCLSVCKTIQAILFYDMNNLFIYLLNCSLSIDAACISAYSVKRQTVSDKKMTNMWKEAVLAQLMYNTVWGKKKLWRWKGKPVRIKLCYNKCEKHTFCYMSDICLRYLSR